MRERLEREFLPLPHIGSLGGLGLMLSLDIVVDKKSKAIPEVKDLIVHRALEQGLYLRVRGRNRLCFSPPLVITQEEADEALDRLYPILAELKLS